MQKVLALNVDGKLTYCSCQPDQRGKGRCNHVTHQKAGESIDDFMQRINWNGEKEASEIVLNAVKPIQQEEIDELAAKIDQIAGCHVTGDNLKEVLKTLTPEQVDQIAKIGFNAAPIFSLPIRDEEYEDENVKNKLYFTNLHKYGVSGSSSAIAQMFKSVGQTPTHKGKMQDIQSSYEKGLTPEEYFAKNYYARQARRLPGSFAKEE